MAAYISIPRDFSRIKNKVLFNLTLRQLVCFGTGALTGVPSYFLLSRTGNQSLAVLGMLFIMMPSFLLAMYQKNGQPLEIVLRQMIETRWIRPRVRPYQTVNYYALLEQQTQKRKEAQAVASQRKTSRRQTTKELQK